MALYVPSDTSTLIKHPKFDSSSLKERKFSIHQIAAGIMVSMGLCLLIGEYAATACTMLTSVPAAAFTHKVLTHSEVSQSGYKSILFYWMVQGGMTLLDYALENSYGYFLCKFILLAAVFGNAATKNKDVFNRIISVDSVKTEVTQCMTSSVTLYDSEGYPINSPSPTAFSDENTFVPRRSVRNESEEESSMMSTQWNRASEASERHDTHAVNRILTPRPAHVNEEFVSESEVTVVETSGHLVTNPLEHVIFGSNDVMKTIQMINVTGQNIMWALKCNALHRLGATPACGVIMSGDTQQIRVCLNGKRSAGIDKMAIDYVLVGSERNYSPHFFLRSDKSRHLLRIHYV